MPKAIAGLYFKENVLLTSFRPEVDSESILLIPVSRYEVFAVLYLFVHSELHGWNPH